MIAVGIRELKNNLSKYLGLVRRGEEVLVTDRGVVVASLRPPGPAAVDPAIPPAVLEMARQGRIRLGGPSDPSVYRAFERVVPEGLAARLLDEERGDR